MDDNEICDLIEMYLSERNGLVVVFRRQLRMGASIGQAFFIACNLTDYDRILKILPIYVPHLTFLHNDDICGIIQILLDTE